MSILWVLPTGSVLSCHLGGSLGNFGWDFDQLEGPESFLDERSSEVFTSGGPLAI